MKFNRSALFFFTLLLLLSVSASASCTCDSDSDSDAHPDDRKTALNLKIGAFAAILAAGAIGVLIPIIGKKIPSLSPTSGLFSVLKAFAGGVILATGAVHIVPDAFESLNSPFLGKPWSEFPFAGLVMGLSMVATMMIDVVAGSCFDKSVVEHLNDDAEYGGAAIAPVSVKELSLSQLLRYRVIAQVLEMGILVHSVIIGVDMGVSQSPDTIKPLLVAIVFHQFFEGIGLGGCIIQAEFKVKKVVMMVMFFARQRR